MSEIWDTHFKNTKKKPVLGRGLGSLLGEKFKDPQVDSIKPVEPDEKPVKNLLVTPEIPHTARLWQIGVENLYPNSNQPRRFFSEEQLRELADSIAEKGILQPIVARIMNDGRYEIIAGERRWRAAQKAGLLEVPVIIKETDDQQALELALIENIQRADLNPIEEAEAYAHLINKYELTQQKLAEKVGKDRVTIANTMRLLNLTPEVRHMVAKGEISLGQAKVLLSVDSPSVQLQLAHKVKNDKLSVRATEKLVVKSFQNEVPTKEFPQDIRPTEEIELERLHLKTLSEELQKIMGTKVEIDYHNSQGKISINFYSLDELNGLADKLRGL